MNQCYYSKENNDKISEAQWRQEYIDGWINYIKNGKYLQPSISHYIDSGVYYFAIFAVLHSSFRFLLHSSKKRKTEENGSRRVKKDGIRRRNLHPCYIVLYMGPGGMLDWSKIELNVQPPSRIRTYDLMEDFVRRFAHS